MRAVHFQGKVIFTIPSFQNAVQAETPVANDASPKSFAWTWVLMLVGVDYFSTLAYLPSMAVDAAGPFAPIAAAAVVAVTFFCALPIYVYLVGRAPDGRGSAGILEDVIPGWRGKLVVLALLGCAAADFVITRSLSLADASVHLLNNRHAQKLLEDLPSTLLSSTAPQSSPFYRVIKTCCEPQVAITLLLTVASYLCWAMLKKGLSRAFVGITTFAVVLYLALTALVVGSGVMYIARHPLVFETWYRTAFGEERMEDLPSDAPPILSDDDLPSAQFAYRPGEPVLAWIARMLFLWGPILLWTFPQMALGFSGFELAMAIVPIVKGRDDAPNDMVTRSKHTRSMMFAAAAIMGLYLIPTVAVAAMLAPARTMRPEGAACNRVLSYFAHGGALADGAPGVMLNPLFGPWFGDLYDASTVLILCLAGAAVTMSLRNLLPHYLHRLGMEVRWAGEIGVILSLLTLAVMLITVVFKASPSAQQWAYATSVTGLLAFAAFAAGYDLWCAKNRTLPGFLLMPLAFFSCGLFVVMLCATAMINQSGFAIASLFIVTIFASSFISRWIRSTELRFEGFDFADAHTQERWAALTASGRMVLAPHRPGQQSLVERKAILQREYWLDPSIPVVFVEAHLGDPSNFYQKPLMRIEREDGLEIIRLFKCVSISHVLAAICVQLSLHGSPPVIVFGWSRESPLKANLNFLIMGEGNIPWMVKELVHHAIKDKSREPRILVG